MKTNLITSPNELVYRRDHLNIFVGGSITGVRDWQKEFCEEVRTSIDSNPHYKWTVNLINPRREHYDGSEDTSRRQIAWEYKYLKLCDIRAFWFEPETLGPITLFEVGKWLHTSPLIGCHESYKRKLDLQEQIRNYNEDQPYKFNRIKLVYSMRQLIGQVISKITLG